MSRPLLLIFFYFSISSGFSQALDAAFEIQPISCLQQINSLNNQSISADSFEWDFCLGDFEAEPAQNFNVNSELVLGYGSDLVYSNGEYYRFIVDRTSKQIWRYDYGSSPTNNPTYQLLEVPSETFVVRPEDIDVEKINGNW